ncbi:MAG: nucleoside hydrolase [Clostridium sp.]
MNKMPILIDCDPGVDDSLAIYLALSHEGFDVKAITVVGGNVSLDKTSANALNLVDYLGHDIKVAKGSNGPLVRSLEIADHVHGESGIGDVSLKASTRSFYEKNAYETIKEEAIKAKGELNIIALGPLTNLAVAIKSYPEIKTLIKGITLMGGAARGGNVTPCAEFNIYVDPEAAKIVYESGIPITQLGLDATHKAFLTGEEVDNMALSMTSDKAINAVKLLKYTQKLCEQFGNEGIVMHDPSAVAYMVDSSIFECHQYHVDIETKGTLTRGKTVVDFDNVTKKPRNVNVALNTDRIKFIDLIQSMLDYYNAK